MASNTEEPTGGGTASGPPLAVAGRWLAHGIAGVLFLAGVSACARMEPPAGGPPDNVPPVVVSTIPDTFARIEPTGDPVVIRFSERISEQPQTGTLEDAVLISPLTGDVQVEHGRQSLEIGLTGGFREGRIYRVRVLPRIQDMFNNPMVSPFELVFSTGPDFHPGVAAGEVLDRVTGDPATDLRVHAVGREAPDSTVYAAITDEEGIYAIRYLPAGPYDLVAFDDRNRNLEPDGAEPRAQAEADLGGQADTAFVLMEVLAPDTTPARIVAVEAVDSTALRIETDDYLDPAESLASVGVSLARADEDAGPAEVPEVDSLLHAHEWDARARAIAAAADTAVPDTAAPDTADAPDDPDDGDPDGAPAGPDPDDPGDLDTAQDAAPDGPPRSEQSIYAILGEPLVPDVAYTVTVEGIRNINGVEGGGGEETVTWQPPPPDTADAEPDTTDAGAPADPADPNDPADPDDPDDPDDPGARR